MKYIQIFLWILLITHMAISDHLPDQPHKPLSPWVFSTIEGGYVYHRERKSHPRAIYTH